MAVWPVLTVAATAVKVAAVCPAAIVKLEGTARFRLLLDIVTVTPPAGAAAVRETVQDVLAGVFRVSNVQPIPLKVGSEGNEAVPAMPLAGIELPGGVTATTPLT